MSNIDVPLPAAKYFEELEKGIKKKWQDLPSEIILKILSYSEVKDRISCGQVSKRTRSISHERSLWTTANLEKKIVKTELLEMILSKGCKNLNLSNSTIIGRLRSTIKSQLRVLDLSQSGWGFPAREWPAQVYYEENIEVLEELLFSSCSLQHLRMEGLEVTFKMAISICKNGNTLKVLNLNHSFVDNTFDNFGESDTEAIINCCRELKKLDLTVSNTDFQAIIKCCQELKELSLNDINEKEGLSDKNLKFLANNISPNVEKLNLSNQNVMDDHVKILLHRCKQIKVLFLEATFITNDSFKNIAQYLNLTLEELTLAYDGHKPFTCFLELKFMQRLKILNVFDYTEEGKEIQNLRQHLPHLMIKTLLDCKIGKTLQENTPKVPNKRSERLRFFLKYLKD